MELIKTCKRCGNHMTPTRVDENGQHWHCPFCGLVCPEEEIEIKYTDRLDSTFGVGGSWIEPVEKCFDNIRTRLNFYIDENSYLRYENNMLKDKHYKDNELIRLKDELEEAKKDLVRGFAITKDEEEAIEIWQKEHNLKMHQFEVYPSAKLIKYVPSGNFYYEFRPFELGISQKCYCKTCRENARIEARGDRQRYEELIDMYIAEYDFSK